MSDRTVLRVERLVKSFNLGTGGRRLGVSGSGAGALVDMVAEIAGVSRYRNRKEGQRILRAVDDVSFDVKSGEVLGVLGRNGAGKTTLLRVLANVLTPTSGRVVRSGRLVALLELGRGFAGDLTVAENVALLGLTSGASFAETRELEPKILEIAQLGEYRDVPLEDCPSGSFVKLSFAAMLSLQTDILLADEILAIGDSEFKEASEARIRDIAGQGGAVLLVSHDIGAVRRNCSRVVWLQNGRLVMDGEPEAVIDAYLADIYAPRNQKALAKAGAAVRILEVRLTDSDRVQIGVLQLAEPAWIECVFAAERDLGEVEAEFRISRRGTHVLTALAPARTAAQGAVLSARILLPEYFLNEGDYTVECRIRATGESLPKADQVLDAADLDFHIVDANPETSGWADWTWNRPGLISPRLEWTIEPAADRTG